MAVTVKQQPTTAPKKVAPAPDAGAPPGFDLPFGPPGVAPKAPKPKVPLKGPLAVATYKPPAKVSIPQTIWRYLTPWAEESGDTFISYMQGYPARVAADYKGRVDTFKTDISMVGKPEAQQAAILAKQADLQAQHTVYQNSPTWAKLLSGPTVSYDSKTGLYSPILAGVPPDAIPAGKIRKVAQTTTQKILKTLAPQDVGMGPAQYKRFITARGRNPSLSPDAFKAKEAVAATQKANVKVNWNQVSNEVRKAKEAKRLQEIIAAPKKPTVTRIPAKKRPPARLSPQDRQNAERQATRVAANIRKRRELIEKYNWPRTAQEVKDQARKKALERAKATPRVGAIPIPMPTPNGKRETENQLSRWAKANPTTAAREIADTNMGTVMAVAAPAEFQQIVRKASPAARTQVLAAVSTEVKEAVQTGTATEVQQAAETAIKEQTKQAQKQATAVKEAVKQAAKIAVKRPPTKAPTKPPTAKRPTKRAPRKPTERKVKKPGKVNIVFRGNKSKTLSDKDIMGAVAWRQGIVYVVLLSPYHQDDLWFSAKKPTGVRVAKDQRGAYKTIQAIGGKIPAGDKTVRLGFQTITIRRPTQRPGEGRAIAFKAMPTRSKKRGRLYETPAPGGKMLSRRPVKG